MGSKLISKEIVAKRDVKTLQKNVKNALELIEELRK